jgi:hypothetical protein
VTAPGGLSYLIPFQLDYIASIGSMIKDDELDRMWKEPVVIHSNCL